MGVKDYIGPAKTISSTLVYDQKELYKYLSKWFEERQYDVNEKDYTEKISATGKKVYAFEWACEKRVDDYAKLIIALSFQAEAENVEVELHDGKKKTVQKGTVTIKCSGFLDKDLEGDWTLSKKTAYQSLMREVYDKMIAKGKMSRYQSQLGKDFAAILADIRTYLKTHRYD